MMTVLLSADALVSMDVAKRYLRDQGYPTDDGDMLRLHINAVSGFIARFTARARLKYSATPVVEMRDGDGSTWIYTREAPIKSLVAVTLYPMNSGSSTIVTGPGTSLFNDAMYYDAARGRIVLQTTCSQRAAARRRSRTRRGTTMTATQEPISLPSCNCRRSD